ncbi:uncharacterized protein LOC128241864 [Mya arenaria]|uniref:uncharacterized protein LOC128241864 n=1 Tax=Mya arenaria TaxID=6604 RepID=UPI0022E5E4A2|nr:uncharacterized protein LOC128241864 [Mya arenaria]
MVALGMTTVVVLFNIILKIANCALQTSDLIKVGSGRIIDTKQQSCSKRSVLECTNFCAKKSSFRGINYVKSSKQCTCLLPADLQGITWIQQSDGHVFIHANYKNVFDNSSPLPTSKTSATTTPSTQTKAISKTTSTKTSAAPTSIKTTAALTSSTTTTATTTTTTAIEATTTQTTGTTTSSTQTTAATTTTPTTTAATTTAPTTKTAQTTTTAAATTITTTKATSPKTSNTPVYECYPDALVCISSAVYVFNGTSLLHYHTIYDLTSGPRDIVKMTSLYKMTSEKVTAAYRNSSSVYLITDSGIDVYNIATKETFNFKETLKWSDLFGKSAPTYFNDVLFTQNGDVYFFSEDTLHVKDSSGDVTKIGLDNNGNKNLYKSKNFSDRPRNITAVCEVDNLTHVFLSEDKVFKFTFANKTWTELGHFIC